MNFIPPTFTASPDGRTGDPGLKWAALLEAGAVVGALAGEDTEDGAADMRNFPAMIRDAGGWRRELAENGIDDLAALMEPGIAALLAVNARGIDATIPARALWREFVAARDALLALVSPDDLADR